MVQLQGSEEKFFPYFNYSKLANFPQIYLVVSIISYFRNFRIELAFVAEKKIDVHSVFRELSQRVLNLQLIPCIFNFWVIVIATREFKPDFIQTLLRYNMPLFKISNQYVTNGKQTSRSWEISMLHCIGITFRDLFFHVEKRSLTTDLFKWDAFRLYRDWNKLMIPVSWWNNQ